MSIETFVICLVVGAVSGWLASSFFRAGSHGPVVDMLVGGIGALVASALIRGFGGRAPFGAVAGGMLVAAVGAMALLVALRLVTRREAPIGRRP